MFELTARRVNLLLAALVTGCVATGPVAWSIGTGWARWVTVAHGVLGLGLLVLAPAKIRGSVRTGMRRGRATRWLSVALGVLVVITVALGLLHATGLWFGVGQWSALWTHVLVAVLVLPLFAWHLSARPTRPRVTDLDRRTVVASGAVLATSGVLYAGQEAVVRAAGLAGGDRRATGSHEVASFDPETMPSVSWIDDRAPSGPGSERTLTVWGEPVDPADLAAAATPVTATLDCTGGWYSTQAWDAVRLADLPGGIRGRSIGVVSATGLRRLFPAGDAERLFLAVGYGGRPLSRGHGAPVRLLAPGRRGPWWVKWVERVEHSDRPWWLQPPFPLT